MIKTGIFNLEKGLANAMVWWRPKYFFVRNECDVNSYDDMVDMVMGNCLEMQ